MNGQKKIDENFKIKFRNQKLSVYKEKIENEISKLLKAGDETILEIFRKIRNEEEHFSLTEKNIINRHCFKIGTSRDSLVLIKKDSSASFENCSFALDFNGAIELAGMKICNLRKNSLVINGFMSFDNYLLTNKKMGWKSNLITVNNDLISKNSFYISKPPSEFTPKIYLVRLDAIRCGTNDRIMGNKIFKLLPSIQRAKENNIFVLSANTFKNGKYHIIR